MGEAERPPDQVGVEHQRVDAQHGELQPLPRDAAAHRGTTERKGKPGRGPRVAVGGGEKLPRNGAARRRGGSPAGQLPPVGVVVAGGGGDGKGVRARRWIYFRTKPQIGRAHV